MSSHINRFTDRDLTDLFRVLDAAAAVDGSAAIILSDSHLHHHHHHMYQQQSFYGGYSQQQLTRLQDEILQCLETLERQLLLIDGNSGEFFVEATMDYAQPVGDKNQAEFHRQQLLQRFLCPLFDQLLKFCRFVYSPLQPLPTTVNMTSTNDDIARVDHFHHHNKVCIFILFTTCHHYKYKTNFNLILVY